MQNQIVGNAIKGLWQTIPGNIGKGLSGISQPRSYLNGSPLLAAPSSSNDLQARTLSMARSAPALLPGGGLGKFQGRFLEEMYFNTNDNKLLAQIPQSGYQMTQKCKDGEPDWSEFERMANACSNTVLLRQTAMLNKHRNGSEESFFLQEQKSLLDRILEILKNLTFNRRIPPPYNPYGHGTPYGPPPYGPNYGPYFQQNAQQHQGEEAVEKQEEENATSNEAENENEKELEAEAEKSDGETEAQNVDDGRDFGNTEWQHGQNSSFDDGGHQGGNDEK